MKTIGSIESIINLLKDQTGVVVEKCESFPGIFFNGGRYFNVVLKERVSESRDYTKLCEFCMKYGTTLKIEPNGLNRIAIFF